MSDAEDAGVPESPGFDLGVEPPAGAAGGYRVLARKYRPTTFDDLIGQEAMVRTLTNAFETDRIPQAWILTGVRGVGKTTTARILARGLNYELPGTAGNPTVAKPTVAMPTLGLHCRAIIESRHVDVIEMDAASHNGVDDIRQINDAVRYAPASARYKVYILDEVHMLSGAAFNALLKTLEEPPPHVKFVFATTDIRKVPVTVLSRCQRFDLRRVETATLVAHLAKVCAAEGVPIDPEALAMIARAAEGSVRDALSLTDQAIAHAAGPVTPAHVRQMLGLADRTRVIDLFDALMRGDIAAALAELADQFAAGADPAIALTELADFTHLVTRIKIVPSLADDPALAESERVRGREFAAALSMRVLSRTWQMLLKGIAEVQAAPKPLPAAEMVLVRIAYAADLPSPEDLVRMLASGGAPPAVPAGETRRLAAGPVGADPAPAPSGSAGFATARGSVEARTTAAALQHAPRPAEATSAVPAAMPAAIPATVPVARPAPTPPPATQPARILATLEDVAALAGEKRDLLLKTAIERDLRFVRIEDGRLDIALEPGASKTLITDLARKLSLWTGRVWVVAISSEPGEPTLRSMAEQRRADVARGVQDHPLVQAVMDRFPGAEITRITPRDGTRAAAAFESGGTADLPDAPPWSDDDMDDEA